MKERPILFGAPMVRALLVGTKTQTRHVVKLPHQNPLGAWEPMQFGGTDGGTTAAGETVPLQDGIWHTRTGESLACPHGQPGDQLWVRESTYRRPMLNFLTGEPLASEYDGGAYAADDVDVLTPLGFDISWWYSRKSCQAGHMPRWASRFLLEIVDVRVERLQDISQADSIAEGTKQLDLAPLDPSRMPYPSSIDQAMFAALWESINSAGSWDANPWVWAITFKKVFA